MLKARNRLLSMTAHVKGSDQGYKASPYIETHHRQSVRQIILNRPKALNSLESSMISTIKQTLKVWSSSDLCKVILFSNHPTSKAFCAGGDVKLVVQEAKEGRIEEAAGFFKEEYTLNHMIATMKKPVISVMNGITMGGGCGLAMHGHFRIATEKTVIAMPETSIGLFPDVGASFFLPRLDGELGTYLGLTGARLSGVDAFKGGFATHFVPEARLEPLMERLEALELSSLEIVNSVIEEFSGEVDGEWALSGQVGAAIDKIFALNSIEEILMALEAEKSEFAQNTLNILASVSPTSLKVTLEQLRRGRGMGIAECLVMEYRMVNQFLRSHDFLEGATAKLVDKRVPSWKPSFNELSVLTPSVVRQLYFGKSANYEDLQLDGTYFDYPHRTLSSLPTTIDVQRVVMGETSRYGSQSPPETRQKVLEWFESNWGHVDKSMYNSRGKTLLELEGSGVGKIGLRERVSSILKAHTQEFENGMRWNK